MSSCFVCVAKVTPWTSNFLNLLLFSIQFWSSYDMFTSFSLIKQDCIHNILLFVHYRCLYLHLKHMLLLLFVSKIGLLYVQIFFHPEIYNSDFTTPLPAVVDKCIQLSPIDTRRALYKASVQILWLHNWTFQFLVIIHSCYCLRI